MELPGVAIFFMLMSGVTPARREEASDKAVEHIQAVPAKCSRDMGAIISTICARAASGQMVWMTVNFQANNTSSRLILQHERRRWASNALPSP